MIKTNTITDKVELQISHIVSQEAERLVKLAQTKGDPMTDDNIAGYITGVYQFAANLNTLIGNARFAKTVCWKCGNALETEDGKDYNNQPVKLCVECGAYIR